MQTIALIPGGCLNGLMPDQDHRPFGGLRLHLPTNWQLVDSGLWHTALRAAVLGGWPGFLAVVALARGCWEIGTGLGGVLICLLWLGRGWEMPAWALSRRRAEQWTEWDDS